MRMGRCKRCGREMPEGARGGFLGLDAAGREVRVDLCQECVDEACYDLALIVLPDLRVCVGGERDREGPGRPGSQGKRHLAGDVRGVV